VTQSVTRSDSAKLKHEQLDFCLAEFWLELIDAHQLPCNLSGINTQPKESFIMAFSFGASGGGGSGFGPSITNLEEIQTEVRYMFFFGASYLGIILIVATR
jgi:hypothetical protein